MKKALHIGLLLLFLLPQVSNTFVWFNYELNKAAITEAHCENKAKPELKCNGKCHLAKQLTEPQPVNGNQPAETVFIPQLDLFFVFNPADAALPPHTTIYETAYLSNYSFTLSTVIDEPPRA